MSKMEDGCLSLNIVHRRKSTVKITVVGLSAQPLSSSYAFGPYRWLCKNSSDRPQLATGRLY